MPRVLLVGVEPTSSDVPALVPKRAAELIARDLAAQPDLELISVVDDAADLASSAPSAPAVDRLDEGKTALVAARGALDSKDWSRAASAARRTIEAYEASAGVLADVAPLIDAYFVLGVALVLDGRETDARTAFRQVLAFEPIEIPNVARHGKKVQKQWDDANKEYGKVGRGTLQIAAGPEEASAIVYIDGANSGDAPVTIPQLGAGVHVIRVVAEGFQPYGQRVLLAADVTEKLIITLEPKVAAAGKPDAVRAALRAELRKRAGTGLLDASAKPIAARLAERLGASHLVVGMISAQGSKGYALRLFLYRADGKKLVELDSLAVDAELLKLETVTLGGSRAVLSAIKDFPADRDITGTLQGAGRDGGNSGNGQLVGDDKHRKKRGDTPVDTPTPLYGKWWFWAGAGAVVAVVVVVGVVVAGGAAPDAYDGSVVLP